MVELTRTDRGVPTLSLASTSASECVPSCPCACCVFVPQLLSQVAVPVESSRAKRSLSRDAVFTSNAGKLKSEDAKVDGNGNVLGPDGELGKKGAFKGLKVVIIMQYSFDFSNPRRALEVRQGCYRQK